ncbi:acyltransferase family protein [Hafnia alvei]|uniref:acyltransferase family protein n=1 Tax=Hafnia alvei TaxID=569 RepID=UPI0010353FB6|nr:acyltransferase [Hafnia alvei]TBL60724.1 acyltransferase [Hafnia alvei]
MKTLHSIQNMRGIASLLVVLFHFRYTLNGPYVQKDLGNLLFSNGAFGVDLFFIISGFIIVYATEKDSSPQSFIIKRMLRIYPVILFVMLMSLTFVDRIHFDANFIKSLFFVPNNFNREAPTFGYVTIYSAWTLTYEVLFYATFLIGMNISHKYRAEVTSIIILLAFIGLRFTYGEGITLEGSSTLTSQGVMPLFKLLSSPMMLEFILGMIIYVSIRKLDKFIKMYSKELKPFSTASLMLSVSFFFICFSSGYLHGHGLSGFGLYAAILFVSYLLHELVHGHEKIKFLSFIGDISYSLYIGHIFVLDILWQYRNDLGIYYLTSGFSRLAVLMVASFIFSMAIFFLIEKPLIKLARKYSGRVTPPLKNSFSGSNLNS